MALSEIDRNLLQRCLSRKLRSWEDFVDRFLGLVIHVVNHSAQSRSIRLRDEDREDLAAEVFLTIVNDDFAILRNFRGESSLSTYLTVVARRVILREILKKNNHATPLGCAVPDVAESGISAENRLMNHEEVQQLLKGLDEKEAEIVRLYHLDGKSYREISSETGVPENSIGPTLSRARAKMSSTLS